MHAFSAKEICRTAKERKGGALGYAEAMLICYNKKMRGGLKWSALYSNQKKLPDDYDYLEDSENAEEETNDMHIPL